MKQIVLLTGAATALLFVAGCNNKTSMENQSTNAPAAQEPAMMNTNSPAGAGTVNTIPPAGVVTNSAGMGTNNPATTNEMNTATNTTPP